jgi:hypothetical protein
MKIDLEKQCRLAIRALDAIVEIAQEAGIETSAEASYDEWENVVQAVFESFVVMPVCDTSLNHTISEFHKLGFAAEKGRVAIHFTRASEVFFIFDLLVGKDEMVIIDARSALFEDGKHSILVNIAECSDFRLGHI